MSLFVKTQGGSLAHGVSLVDMLEQGACREVMGDKCLSPLNKKKAWQETYVESEGKDNFRMVDEKSGALLLTAKRWKGDFYISMYEDFPQSFKGASPKGGLAPAPGSPQRLLAERRRYCSVLRLNEAKNGYRLVSCACELCDQQLGKFSCGVAASPDERQVLAEVKHVTRVIAGTEIEARCLDVQLPALTEDDPSQRVVWCPRTMAHGVHGSIAEEHARLRRQGSSSSSGNTSGTGSSAALRGVEVIHDPNEDVESKDDSDDERERSRSSRGAALASSSASAKALDRRISNAAPSGGDFAHNSDKDRYFFMTKLPVWNDEMGSLVLKFRNARVLEASSKNFILADKRDPERAIFQLGKHSQGRFNLDFKHPISPLQAFGLALSAYGFVGGQASKK
jgi:hypothetical protein